MNLRLVLGDQLSHDSRCLYDASPDKDQILMMEVIEEATYVKHHQLKLVFIFSAMRHFAEELKQRGFTVHYLKLDETKNAGGFNQNILSFKPDTSIEKLIVTEPSEYRVLQKLKSLKDKLTYPLEIRADDRFLATKQEFDAFAKGRKQLRMEYFYRAMRKKYNILMSDDKPEGGKWNFDHDNRNPPNFAAIVPSILNFETDEVTLDVIELVLRTFPDHMGDANKFNFAVTRKQALAVFDDFLENRLAQFGKYQDAMIEGQDWMYHSLISQYLNVGLLKPLEVVKRAEIAYFEHSAPLAAVEGFIRQVLGWREFVRGLYWHKMPAYEEMNFFAAERDLPEFFWNGDTKMNCLRQVIQSTIDNAYAHHIQRLMVIGNFALLTGLDPRQVNEWFLVVYADA
ncbi:MAG: cryptochrome/photolyase family protein, partial [Alphaproteobacteria bacterium]|nr:cryptochrome/photolyase family protein [Alphaproteobacteria bacterium]